MSDAELTYLLRDEILPFFVLCEEPINERCWIPDDPEDNKFVDLARVLPASVLVSGDSIF